MTDLPVSLARMAPASLKLDHSPDDDDNFLGHRDLGSFLLNDVLSQMHELSNRDLILVIRRGRDADATELGSLNEPCCESFGAGFVGSVGAEVAPLGHLVKLRVVPSNLQSLYVDNTRGNLLAWFEVDALLQGCYWCVFAH